MISKCIFGCFDIMVIIKEIIEVLIYDFYCVFVCIWLIEFDGVSLKLVVLLGLYISMNGSFVCVLMGVYKVGKIV